MLRIVHDADANGLEAAPSTSTSRARSCRWAQCAVWREDEDLGDV